MLTRRTLITTSLFSFFLIGLNAQNTAFTASTALAVPSTYGIQADEVASADAKEDFLPYAEPILGIEKEEYENHFSEYRVGSLMDRVMDLNHMELQAIYADSKMNEINISFNSQVEQDLVVNVYDQFGMKVKCEMHNTLQGINNYKINTEDLPEGFYSMVVIGDNEQFIQRFIIE